MRDRGAPIPLTDRERRNPDDAPRLVCDHDVLTLGELCPIDFVPPFDRRRGHLFNEIKASRATMDGEDAVRAEGQIELRYRVLIRVRIQAAQVRWLPCYFGLGARTPVRHNPSLMLLPLAV